MIRILAHQEPGELSEHEWAKRVNEIFYCLELLQNSIWGAPSK
jgi:hypothetical protein